MFTTACIDAEKGKIRQFLSSYFASSDYSRDYGMPFGSPVRFTIWREGQRNVPVLDNIFVIPPWRRKGLATLIFECIESCPESVDCWVHCALTPEIQALLEDRGYRRIADHDYVKVIQPERSFQIAHEKDIAAVIKSLPLWKRWLPSWMR